MAVINVNLEARPKDRIANVITEMICHDCPISVIMDAVVLSKMIMDEEKKEK